MGEISETETKERKKLLPSVHGLASDRAFALAPPISPLPSFQRCQRSNNICLDRHARVREVLATEIAVGLAQIEWRDE